ncbi:MAG: ArsR family transcriptional regulator [Anaerolinea sp.]|nr:ArsR family transcriptional regulator [Anaerolinea sp.]
MQETRRHILDILRRRGQATVDDIVDELQKRRGSITAVTVRHHLMRLQEEDLITSPELRRRSSPGRPQYIYALTEKAKDLFPNNYQRLAMGLLMELQKQLPKDGVNVILEGVADTMAQDVYMPDAPLAERLDVVVEYLNQSGYEASWQREGDNFLLITSNCPYHGLAEGSGSLCQMDMRLVSTLLGVIPRRLNHVMQGDAHCSYLIPQVTNGR